MANRNKHDDDHDEDDEHDHDVDDDSAMRVRDCWDECDNEFSQRTARASGCVLSSPQEAHV